MAAKTNTLEQLAFIGFGEAAAAFLSGWGASRPRIVSAFDIKSGDADAGAAMQARYVEHGVAGAPSAAQALRGAEAAFSVVTADQAVAAAEAAAAELPPQVLWFDCNSCSPGAKRKAASVVEAAGGRYVDVAVMSPVHPLLHRAPLLVSGPHAETAVAVLEALDMKPKIAGSAVGDASSIKMLRSVMIKGVEALTAECFLAARRAGVEESVIASLEASDPDIAWRRRGAYNLERMTVHGARRAAEMREAAETVRELGLSGAMAAAAADWQDLLGALDGARGGDDLIAKLDAVLDRL